MIETAFDMMPPSKWNDPDALEASVVGAYRALFEGRGGQTDASTVLVDLMMVSGWNDVLNPGASATELADLNGARRVMGRIMFVLALPPERVRQLQEALLRAPVVEET